MKKFFYLLIFLSHSVYPYAEFWSYDNKLITISEEVWCEDKTAKYSAYDILNNSIPWKNANKLETFSDAKKPSVYWLKFKINNYTGYPVVLTRYANVKDVDYYEIISSDSVRLLNNITENNTLNYKFGIQEFSVISNYSPEKYFLIRFETFHRVYIGVDAPSSIDYIRLRSWQYVLISIFIGTCFILFAYNILIGILTKSATNIHFGFYIFFTFWYVLTMYNIVPVNLLGIKYYYLSYFIPYSFSTVTLIIFTQNYFNIINKHKIVFQILNVFIFIKIFTFIVILCGYTEEIVYTSFTDMCLIVGTFFCIIYLYIKHNEMRNTFKYFITGFVVILVHMGFRHIREILLAKYEDTLLTFLYDNQFLFTGLLIIFIFTILTFEKFRATLIEKNTYQKQLIEQLTYNQTLKDEINSELEIKVLEKTQTILEQTQRITEMNDILKKHNIELASALEQKEETIISNRIINYEEYRKKFKDDDACYEFLSQMKWANGFNCKKCNCTYYNFKDSKYVRRCKKCSYVESPTNYTIFENVRFSINKAFYLVYVIHSGKKIKIEELSNDISTRPQTIIEFTKKVKLYISKIPKRKLSRMTWLDLIVHSH